MRRTAFILALAIGLTTLGATTASACGDKLLALGTGMRFVQQLAAHPGSLLLYARPGSASAPILLNPKFQDALTDVGHKVTIVTTEKELKSAMASGSFDILVVDQADAESLSKEFASDSTAPFVLPVVCNGTRAQASQAAREFGCALRAPDRKGRYLGTVDRAMKIKLAREGGETSGAGR